MTDPVLLHTLMNIGYLSFAHLRHRRGVGLAIYLLGFRETLLIDWLAVDHFSDHALQRKIPDIETGTTRKARIAWIGCEKRGLVLRQERFDRVGRERKFLR